MKFLRFNLWLLLSLFAARADAALPDESKLPPELRALFVEAPDEVTLKQLPNFPNSEPIRAFWIDNHRVIITSRHFNGWDAKRDERSKILIYHIDEARVEETAYRGNLQCFGPEGQMLIQDYPLRFPNAIQPGDSVSNSRKFIKGRFGEPPEAFVSEPFGGVVDDFSCQFYKNRIPSSSPNYYIIRLRNDDGFVEQPGDNAPDGTVRLRSATGEIKWEIKTNRSCNYFSSAVKYLSWTGSYYGATAFGGMMPGCGDINKNSWLFSQGTVQVQPLPALIQEARRIGKGFHGNGTSFWARRGMYVLVQSSAYGVLDGLFFQDAESMQLKRVLRRPWGLEELSPDGCRALVRSNPAVVIELCKGVIK